MSSLNTVQSLHSQYLPSFEGYYINPNLTAENRAAHIQNRVNRLNQALEFLSEFDRPKIIKKRCCPLPICDNSVWNLGVYFFSRPLAVIGRAFFCCFSCDDDLKKPIPKEAAETLKNTSVQFERNTCGVCCIAPAVIIGTPFIPASALVLKILGIISGLVITTTAGTDTYVFSGDIGVVDNEQGDLIIQGGIRVDAISAIKNAYIQLTDHLEHQWSNGDNIRKRELAILCGKICLVWNDIFNAIVLCGIKESVVKEILAPFSIKVYQIVQALPVEGYLPVMVLDDSKSEDKSQ